MYILIKTETSLNWISQTHVYIGDTFRKMKCSRYSHMRFMISETESITLMCILIGSSVAFMVGKIFCITNELWYYNISVDAWHLPTRFSTRLPCSDSLHLEDICSNGSRNSSLHLLAHKNEPSEKRSLVRTLRTTYSSILKHNFSKLNKCLVCK